MSLLTFVPTPLRAARQPITSGTLPAPISGRPSAPARPQPDAPAVEVTSAARGDSTAAPTSGIAVGLRLSFEAHLIAVALFHTRLLQLPGQVAREEDLEPLFKALSVPARQAYYEASEVAIQRLDEAAHARAAAAAESVLPGFTDALEVYHAALRFAPARRDA